MIYIFQQCTHAHTGLVVPCVQSQHDEAFKNLNINFPCACVCPNSCPHNFVWQEHQPRYVRALLQNPKTPQS